MFLRSKDLLKRFLSMSKSFGGKVPLSEMKHLQPSTLPLKDFALRKKTSLRGLSTSKYSF